MSKHYPIEQRERAVKMVLDHLDEYRSVYAAAQAIGPKVGVGPETLRKGAAGSGRRSAEPWGHHSRAATDQGVGA